MLALRLVTRTVRHTNSRAFSVRQIAEFGFYSQHRPLALPPLAITPTVTTSPLHQLITDYWTSPPSPLVCPLAPLATMYAISILKRRRKKMNKHKWKKHRKAFRDSSRYNKEKRRKRGIVREKQE